MDGRRCPYARGCLACGDAAALPCAAGKRAVQVAGLGAASGHDALGEGLERLLNTGLTHWIDGLQMHVWQQVGIRAAAPCSPAHACAGELGVDFARVLAVPERRPQSITPLVQFNLQNDVSDRTLPATWLGCGQS